MRRVTKALIGRVDWSTVETAVGNAKAVPGALADLIHASSEEDAKSAYWAHLDNEIVVQGTLYEAAALVVFPILVELASRALSPAARYRSVDLLVEITLGGPPSSDDSGVALQEACITALREGLSTLYALLDCEDERVVVGAIDILERVDPQRARLRDIVSTLPSSGSPIVEERVRELLGA